MCFTFYKMVVLFVFHGQCHFIKLCLKFINWCICFIKCLLYFSESEMSFIKGWLAIYGMWCVRLLKCCTYFCALFCFFLKSYSVFLSGAVISLKWYTVFCSVIGNPACMYFKMSVKNTGLDRCP